MIAIAFFNWQLKPLIGKNFQVSLLLPNAGNDGSRMRGMIFALFISKLNKKKKKEEA
jgi:hypothetical protein